MSSKRILYPILASLAVALALMYFIYGFVFSLMNISNVLFIVGICLFFPGLIIISGASSLFHGVDFLARKVLTNPQKSTKYFDNFNDYLVAKNEENTKFGFKEVGYIILAIGGAYIFISIVASMFV